MTSLEEIVERLRAEGGDLPAVEVKSAAGGYPDSLISSICALANRPGGGMIILGLDERSGFSAVKLSDPRRLKETLASQARQALQPPILIEVFDAEVEGAVVVVAIVPEVDAALKPCRVTGGSSRGVWLRAFDGDYRASDIEIQGLVAARSKPQFDAVIAPGAQRVDLDRDLVAEFLAACRRGSTQLARMSDDDELLWKMGVLVGDQRQPSVAGVLALGTYPQQYMPAYGLQASLVAPPGSDLRAADARRFDGPIPAMIADATAWVGRVTPTALRSGPDGQVRDVPAFPVDAVRELVANSLIHRDLAPWSAGETSILRLDQGKMVVRNPGGLFGLTADKLGRVGVTSARNATLVRICQYVRLPDGGRAVEALASGIPTVLQALEAAALSAPIFDDDGLRFTVIVRGGARGRSAPLMEGSLAVVFAAVTPEGSTISQLVQATGLQPPNIRKHLRRLRSEGLVNQIGGKGLTTVYTRSMNRTE